MRVVEITKTPDEAQLFLLEEALTSANAEQILEESKEGEWSTPMTSSELLIELKKGI